MTPGDRGLGRLGVALFGGAVLAWVVFTVTSAYPASSRFPLFHSDDAIPVLMVNAERWTPYSLFFYGMNRFGGWPFLLPWLAHAVAGVAWSPAALAVVAALWVCGGAVPLWRLLDGAPRLAVLGYFALLACSPLLRMHLFELAQVYPWQLPALLWAWDALRRLASAGSDWRRRAAIAFAFSALATWSSSLSGPLLVMIAAAEALLRAPRPEARRLRSALAGLGVAGAAMLVEWVLRRWFQNYARRHFGYPYKTNLALEPRSVLAGLGAFASAVWTREALIVGLLGLSVLGLLVAAVRARRAWSPRTFEGLRPSTLVALVSLGLAAASLLAASASAHVRENDYNPRYIAPSCFFIGLAALAVLGQVAEAMARTGRARAVRDAGLAVGALALLAVLPAFPRNPDFDALADAAREMERARGRSVLLGGYWGTYVFAALASPGGLVPVPEETQYPRTPFLTPPEEPGAEVLLTDYAFDGFGEPGNPDAWIVDHALVYRRVEGARWSNAKVSFWRYRRVAAEPAQWSEPPDAWKPDSGAPLRVTLDAGGAPSLLVAFSERGTQLPRVELLTFGGRRALAVEEQGQRFARYRVPAAGNPALGLELRWDGPPRPLRHAAIVVAP